MSSSLVKVAANTIAKPASFETRFAKLTAKEYFSEPCAVPALSASVAHTLDSQSPLHAWTRHAAFGNVSRTPTKSFDAGSLSHALLLGEGKEIVIIEAADYRTNAAKDARDAARAAGKIPVLEEDFALAQQKADILRSKFADLGIVLDGKSELTALWTETASNGAKVQCRGMLDHVKLPIIWDLKSTASAHPEVCRKHIESYGYAIQRAAYVSAVERICPELAGRVDFIFIFFELEPPYDVLPVRLSGAFKELGERAWRRSVDRWEACLRTNVWPGYANRIVDLDPSPWAFSRDMDRQLSGQAVNDSDDEELT